MKAIKILALIIALILAGENCFAASSAPDKGRLEDSLAKLMMFSGDYPARPNPQSASGAREIIDMAWRLAFLDNMDAIKRYNQPLKQMDIDNFYLFPAEMVDKAVCKYFGFDIKPGTPLADAAQEKMAGPDLYALADNTDAAIVAPVIKSVARLENGSLLALGRDEESEQNFKAYFENAACGGRRHWVLTRLEFGKEN